MKKTDQLLAPYRSSLALLYMYLFIFLALSLSFFTLIFSLSFSYIEFLLFPFLSLTLSSLSLSLSSLFWLSLSLTLLFLSISLSLSTGYAVVVLAAGAALPARLHLLAPLPAAPRLAVLADWDSCERGVRLWFPLHAPPTLCQLQAEECGASPLEGIHVQSWSTLRQSDIDYLRLARNLKTVIHISGVPEDRISHSTALELPLASHYSRPSPGRAVA